MSEERKLNPLVIAVVIVLALFIALSTVSTILAQVDVSTLPSPLAGTVTVIKYVFAAAAVGVVIGFGRNLVGYGINWMRNKRKDEPEVEYSLTWLSESLVKFEGVVVCVTPFVNVIVTGLPAEYKTVAMIVTASLFAFIDMIISEIKYVIKEMRSGG